VVSLKAKKMFKGLLGYKVLVGRNNSKRSTYFNGKQKISFSKGKNKCEK
jgi:hypothetical protein